MLQWIRRLKPSAGAATHLIRFTMYNLVGALLPLLIALTIRRIGDVPDPPGAYAPELLFFGVMIGATALGDVTDESHFSGRPVFQFIKGALLFGSLVVAMIFGVYEYDVIIGPGNPAFRANITQYSAWLAISIFVASMIAELLIARIRGLAIVGQKTEE